LNDLLKARRPAGPEPVLAGEVAGHALFRLSARDAPALRRRPGPIPDGWQRVSPALLRYADEQTIAGTAAVFSAMESMGAAPERFEGWGVVAASRFLGRTSLSIALRNFDAEGVWGVSPHLIPHFALHSPSGTISLALGLQGPNLGVGGGVHAAAEGFLAALTWLATGVVPGVWLVLSGWEPELVPDRRGVAPPGGECLALAIALAAVGADGGRQLVRAVAGTGARQASSTPKIASLVDRLQASAETGPRSLATDPSGRLRFELVSSRKEGTAGDDA
jgi:hypothetical protein